MRTFWLIIPLAIAESLAFAQLDSDTLTVSVSQSFKFQPDQVVFNGDVITSVNVGLDEVIAKLKGVGITSAMFSGVYSIKDPLTLRWHFTVPVPLSDLQATIARLTALKVTFYLQGSQVSQQSRDAQQCYVPSLMALAQSRAKAMADPVELVVGQVLELSDESGVGFGYSQPGPVQWFHVSLINTILTTPVTIRP